MHIYMYVCVYVYVCTCMFILYLHMLVTSSDGVSESLKEINVV